MPYAEPTAIKIIGKIVERIDKGTLKRTIAPKAHITEHITVKSGKNTPVNLLKERNKTPKTTMITRGTKKLKSWAVASFTISLKIGVPVR